MLDNEIKKYIDSLFRKQNRGMKSSDLNALIDGGGHGLFKKEGKWNFVVDYVLTRLGVTSTFLRLLEQSAEGADVAGYGQLWILDNAPNELWFTDDDGNNMLIASLTNNITVIDADDVNIADGGGIIIATEVEAALQEIKALVDINVTHISSDGSDHSKVTDNETAIGLNTTHRGLTNNPHTVTAAQLGLGSGLTNTYTFGGGASGEIATMTFTNGILTGVTTVP